MASLCLLLNASPGWTSDMKHVTHVEVRRLKLRETTLALGMMQVQSVGKAQHRVQVSTECHVGQSDQKSKNTFSFHFRHLFVISNNRHQAHSHCVSRDMCDVVVRGAHRHLDTGPHTQACVLRNEGSNLTVEEPRSHSMHARVLSGAIGARGGISCPGTLHLSHPRATLHRGRHPHHL